ncbi:MAG: sigma-70 family RNA polymerase sigma factor [Gammaproteobacteria bacterium]|nr:sigma-70 family RNA polymerase sigma factor [Gammaproteobacteria bacterium]MBU0849639.1 sigma-70 family RNA polymerase sigma factor [Gammaproteobacteria bacterium]MBU1266090.1 sigma-70 family RNA polymerase sigma factor [Gammaproteobacteria bacterium]MBU1529281.1 sigma-70 family RNA polymerase sigma factor [Gammaproteobacteria bacterium]MBU1779340.1 sigma-70 family RNA polymerase sigma factor [Gammaproteobacteria bacterium]
MEQQNLTQQHEISIQFTDEASAPLTPAQLQTLETLLKTQQSRLTHFVRKHLRREDYVDDLIQQTHMAAFRNWAGFRGESKPETWLFGIALNLVKNFRYRDTSYRFQDDDFDEQISMIPADSFCEPEESLMRQERMESLKQAIDHLPSKMQNVVQLVLLDGFTYQDAAMELDLPIGTVRSRLSRARDMLRVEVMGHSASTH